ncbi:hypothetical protein F2Q70_00017204 [Brassica cretica]|uniref:Uncharacterized protein n=1 Tax=Brassica cretica TaxID=69181 RepID=A0A3N6QU23_BRACR|nr:hypothetical protein F2Q70_00017204 [Brassica cretica]KAF2597120.1 hypothetical protein F2Q68_00010149 [Brassica cretica]
MDKLISKLPEMRISYHRLEKTLPPTLGCRGSATYHSSPPRTKEDPLWRLAEDLYKGNQIWVASSSKNRPSPLFFRKSLAAVLEDAGKSY